MTIATEIQRLQGIKSEIMAALERKNVDTTGKNISDVGDLIRSIGEGQTVRIGEHDYPYVKIGNLYWLSKNLDFVWSGLEKRVEGDLKGPLQVAYPSCCYYDYDEKYGFDGTGDGLLYNYYAAKELEDNKSLFLPNGWRVPKAEDFNDLNEAIGGNSNKLKSINGRWSISGATDETGFMALPSGGVYSSSEHYGRYAIFASCEESSSSDQYIRPYIDNYDSSFYYNASWYKWYRSTIRLVKDA